MRPSDGERRPWACPDVQPPVVGLYGATALGKTEIALAVAERLDADIVVADSMQVYEGLPILTNQPGSRLQARAQYHLVGMVAPQCEFSVADYARLAHETIDRLLAQGTPVVLEGGSGLYLRAALGDLSFAAPPHAALRAEFDERWARDPAGVLAELRRADAQMAAHLDANNPRRVLRALEAVRAGEDTGAVTPVERGRLWRRGERYRHVLVALLPDVRREALKARIDARVEEMLAAGALDEVRRARAAGPLSRTAAQAIGVRELADVLDGRMTLEQAATRMKSRTRALARRQLTWLRKLPAAAQVSAAGRPPAAVAADVLALVHARAW